MKRPSGKVLPIAFSIVAIGAVVGINSMASKSVTTPVDISSPAEAPEAPRVQPDFERHPSDANKYSRELARRSKGRFEALGAEDRKFLDGMTSGHGKDLLANTWRAISSEKKPADAAPEHR